MGNITITFRDLDTAQAANLFAAIRHDWDGPAPTLTAPAEAPIAAAQPSTDAPAVDLDTVRRALQDVMQAKGMPACVMLLKKYNAARISELPALLYAAVVQDCAALLA